MQRYRRPLGDGPLKYRGKRYAGGTVVEMVAVHAAPLLARGRLEGITGAAGMVGVDAKARKSGSRVKKRLRN